MLIGFLKNLSVVSNKYIIKQRNKYINNNKRNIPHWQRNPQTESQRMEANLSIEWNSKTSWHGLSDI